MSYYRSPLGARFTRTPLRFDHQHPEYRDFQKLWMKCRHTFMGEEAVKDQMTVYLKALTEQESEDYEGYRDRAVFLNTMKRTVNGLVGAAMRKLPILEFPDGMQSHMEDVDLLGNNIYEFIQKVLQEVLISGRCCVVVDRFENGRCYLTTYNAENFINWRVYEKTPVMATFAEEVDTTEDGWEHDIVTQYRIFDLDEEGNLTVKIAVEEMPDEDSDEDVKFKIIYETAPMMRGELMKSLPVVCINSLGCGFSVQAPPLLDLANLALSHYRTSADLEHGRHFTSLPQAWITGVDPDEYRHGIRVGSQNVWVIPNETAKVGYLEFQGTGLGSLENALKEKEAMMAMVGARLLEGGKRGVESAEATKVRQNIESSVLSNVVISVQHGILKALRFMGEWEGFSSDDINLEMNMDFIDVRIPHQEIIALVQSYQMGGISMDTLLHNLKQGEVIPHDVTIEEERDKIELDHGAIANIPEEESFRQVRQEPDVVKEADENINPNGDAS